MFFCPPISQSFQLIVVIDITQAVTRKITPNTFMYHQQVYYHCHRRDAFFFFFKPNSVDSFLISLQNLMLWILIRSASMRCF